MGGFFFVCEVGGGGYPCKYLKVVGSCLEIGDWIGVKYKNAASHCTRTDHSLVVSVT